MCSLSAISTSAVLRFSVIAALLCAVGFVVPSALAQQDYGERKAFLETKARAEIGEAEAQYKLGLCYGFRLGVELDDQAAKSNAMSARNLEDLKKTMSRRQIAKAKKRSSELQAQIEARLKSGGK